MNENEVKKCPKCDRELENGVMQASLVAFWNKDGIEERLTSVLGSTGRSLVSQAFRCKNCDLIVFYYGRNTKRLTP